MTELRPDPHAEKPQIEAARVAYPWHVELLTWRELVFESKAELDARLKRLYGEVCSWSDHLGARTFGFKEYAPAYRFADEFGAVPAYYKPQLIIDETVIPPEPPPLTHNELAGMEPIRDGL